LEGGPPIFRQDFTCPALLMPEHTRIPVRGCHPLRPLFPKRSGSHAPKTGLIRVRSPLLAESRLISFPPGTEMFQFPGFASHAYVFSTGYRLRGGLPHSDIHGSKPARGSPWLFAACHVLHRLLTPRHSPNALLTLDPNHPSQPNSTFGAQTKSQVGQRPVDFVWIQIMTDKFSDLYIYPLHPIRSWNRSPRTRTDPSRPQTERIRQNPLHNVKQPRSSPQHRQHNVSAMRRIKLGPPKQLNSLSSLRRPYSGRYRSRCSLLERASDL
jgi:hypothetical protein